MSSALMPRRALKLARHVFSILVSLTVALVGCRSQQPISDPLVGNWEGKNSEGDVQVFFQFRNNGTGGCVGAGRGTVLGALFHYRLENGAILITSDDPSGGSTEYRFQLSKNRLILTADKETLVLRPADSDFAQTIEAQLEEYRNTHPTSWP